MSNLVFWYNGNEVFGYEQEDDDKLDEKWSFVSPKDSFETISRNRTYGKAVNFITKRLYGY